MGIFGNKDKALPSLFETDELEQDAPAVDYNSALDWLTGLSDEDYKKVCTVAEIYRKAQAEAAEALGIENTPTTFITVPVDETVQTMDGKQYQVGGETILDDDEDADIAAILDEPEFLETDTKNKKSKQIEVDGK